MIKRYAATAATVLALGLAACTAPAEPTTDDRPIYGGCKEWRPAYGPKPADCR